MIKAAIEYIVGLGNTKIEEVNGQQYSTERLHLIPEATPESIKVRSLSGLVEYLKSEFDEDEFDGKMIHVVSPTEVLVFSSYNQDYSRNEYIRAQAMLPEFSFDRFYSSESIIGYT